MQLGGDECVLKCMHQALGCWQPPTMQGGAANCMFGPALAVAAQQRAALCLA